MIARAADADAPPAAYHALSAGEVLRSLGSTPGGLDAREAARRLDRYGANLLETARPASPLRILTDQLRSVVVLLLAVAAGIAFAMGDLVEAAAIFAVLLINTLLGFVTELRARRAMEGLLGLEVARATVVREGARIEIDASRLVPGDIVALEAGRSVPADARVVRASDLRTNEAPLTGESVPVDKTTEPLDPDTPLADRTNMLYKGTTVAAGTAQAVVVATGMATEVGRIGQLVSAVSEERTPLEQRLDALGRRLVWITLAVAALVAATGVLRGLDLITMVETGIALAIAAVPEGLPAVATITLGVGLRRMARRRALIRRLPAVEALGSATVICTDKTGTLTAGEQTVTHMHSGGRDYDVTGTGYQLEGEFLRDDHAIDPAEEETLGLALRIATLANRATLDPEPAGDPTDIALIVVARKAGLQRDALLEDWPETGEVPFSSERKLMATFNGSEEAGLIAHVKGAPAEIVRRCTRMAMPNGEETLDDAAREELLKQNRVMAAQGLRVIALAAGPADAPREDRLNNLTFAAFAAMIDPPAEGVAETVRRFRRAGIRTVMLTGDQKLTAEAIGRGVGVLEPDEEVIDGGDLDHMSDDELILRIARLGGFSRVSPENKLRIVSAYQANNEVVAMLGDGVNDAAALKKASIGVAMGRRGTDVAKESADVILQDDRFQTIGAAIEEGRVIYDNIRKFVFYLFSCNLAEVFVLLGAGLAGLPLPLLPLQILWLNLVTDTLPALALALEPADAGVMDRPPRPPNAPLLSRTAIKRILQFAALITASTLAAFLWGVAAPAEGGPPAFRADLIPEAPAASARAVTLAFMTLGLAQIFHLGNARSTTHVVSRRAALRNPYALGAVAIAIALQAAAIHAPGLSRVLGTHPLGPADWALVLALGTVPAVVGQFAKRRGTPALHRESAR